MQQKAVLGEGTELPYDIPVQEKEVDPKRIETMPDFGRELTQVRQRAGLTVRSVAKAAGLPVSTAGDYFAGRHLPPLSQPDLLPAILRACGETEPSRIAEWASALSRARRRPGPRPANTRPPYRGLASFEPEDAPWYFGREEITKDLARLATDAPASGDGTKVPSARLPLVVVGPSGSGKSSLLRAGLIPQLTSSSSEQGAAVVGTDGTRQVVLLAPGAHPLTELAANLRPVLSDTEIEESLRGEPADAAEIISLRLVCDLVVVVDQFEAVFTDCPDELERQAFIAVICSLARKFAVVVALRADFYGQALRYPQLALALQQRQIVLPPMSAEQVRRVICEPARLDGLDVDDGLIEVLLRDLAPAAAAETATGPAHEAGALPLLSHSLLVTWEHSRGGRLTVADYLAGGGIRQAIARTAEAVYASLDEEQQAMAQRIFLRLVQVSDDAPVTRAPVALSDLYNRLDSALADDLLARFVDERLISVGPDTAQITHDALLTAWPRLQGWIETGRQSLRMRRRISQAAHAWQEAGLDSGALLRGGLLALAQDWAASRDHRDSLGAISREFLDASISAEQERRRAERRHTRRLRRLVAGLTVLTLATLGLAGYAFQQRHAAVTARDAATAARNIADSRDAATEANQQRGLDLSLAAQLSLAAYQVAPTTQARASLLESSGTTAAARLTDSSEAVQAVSLSPDQRVLAIAAQDGTLRLWNISQPGHPSPIGQALVPRGPDPLYAASFSPNGRLLAAAGAAASVSLWKVSNPRHPIPLSHKLTGPANTVYSVAFSPNGRLLAAGSADKTVRLWNIASLAHPALLATLTGFANYVHSVAFSPNGKTLAAGSSDKTVRLWDISNPRNPTRLGKPLHGPSDEILAVTFSPGGTILAAGSKDDKVWLWNVARPGRPTQAGPPLTGAASWINTVAFGPSGTASIAAGSSDNTIRIWDLSTRQATAILPVPQPVTTMTWDGSGHLITGTANGTAQIWSLPSPTLLGGSPVNSVAFSPDGQLLAVGGNTLELWDAITRQQLFSIVIPGAAVNAVAFSRKEILAAGYTNGTVQLWRPSTTGLIRLGPPFLGSAVGSAGSQLIESAAFSPDGAILATGGDDGTVRLWSVSDPARPQLLAIRQDSNQIVFSVAFSPDGDTLAAASSDTLTRLWDVTNPASPSRIGSPLKGPAKIALSIAFSPDGNTLAIGGADGTVHMWDTHHPAQPRPLGLPLSGPTGYVWSLAFSPDGTTLAAGITDGTVWLWKITKPADPDLFATLTGPTHQVYSVAFSPDGRTLAAGSYDSTVRLWDTSPQGAAAAICATAGQPLTKGEWATYMTGLPYRPPCASRSR